MMTLGVVGSGRCGASCKLGFLLLLFLHARHCTCMQTAALDASLPHSPPRLSCPLFPRIPLRPLLLHLPPAQVLGPVLGGALSQAWGWRSTFIALAAFTGLAGLAVVTLIRTETHQHFVLQRLAKTDREGAKGLQEWDAVTSTPPVFSAPWVPLRWGLLREDEGGKPAEVATLRAPVGGLGSM